MLTEALIKLSLESLQCEQNPPTFTSNYYCTHLVPVPNIRSFPLNVSDLTQNLHQKFKRETRQERGSTRTRSGSTTWERISTTGESGSTIREGTSTLRESGSTTSVSASTGREWDSTFREGNSAMNLTLTLTLTLKP